MISRRKFIAGAGLTVTAAAGGGYWWHRKRNDDFGLNLSDQQIHRARALLSRIISVDVHAHPGRSFVANAENLNASARVFTLAGAFEKATIKDMMTAGLTVASFATVSDFQLLGIGDSGISAVRDFEPGEAWRSYQNQIQRLHEMVDQELMTPVLTPADILRAKKKHLLGGLLTTEGGDFLEGRLEHLEQAYDDGVRSITLVHYHINEIGDIQTAAPRHNGLTAFGHELIKAMNSKGMLIDLAHAAKSTAIAAIEASEKPVMISHTAIRQPGFDSPRFIDLDTAKLVADNEGIVGAWPAGIGLANLSDFSEQVARMIDLIGIDHVVLGTDMDANYKPVLDNYQQLPLLVAALLARGLSEPDVSKFLGENFLRVFGEIAGQEPGS